MGSGRLGDHPAPREIPEGPDAIPASSLPLQRDAHRLRVLLPSVLSPKRIGALEPVNRPWLYWVGLSTQGAGYVSGVTYRCDRFV